MSELALFCYVVVGLRYPHPWLGANHATLHFLCVGDGDRAMTLGILVMTATYSMNSLTPSGHGAALQWVLVTGLSVVSVWSVHVYISPSIWE